MAYIGKSPSQAVRNRYYYTQSGNGATSLSGSDDASNTLTFADGNYVDVLLNGVTLVAGTDYNTSTANTIAGLSALSSGDVVQVIVYDTFSVFSGNVNGDFTVGGDIVVSGTVDSRDVNADGTKLDGIEASATADQTASEIRTLVESASDSNVFTDADHSKLNAIEASADVTDATNVASAGAAMLSGATFTGNLLVGQTSNNAHLNSASGDGLTISTSGEILQGTTGESMILNRRGSDGTILRFRKDGGTVATFGVMNTNNPFIANDADNSGLQFGSGSITPSFDGAGQNNAVDLGSSSTKFKDGYFSNELQCYYIRGQNDTNTGITFNGSDVLSFTTGGSERGRLDASGVFMVGKTAASFDNDGFQIQQDGMAAFTRNGAQALYVNRRTSEGPTIEIRQDNDPQLLLGSKFSGRGYISSNVANSTGIRFDTNFIAPCDATGANRINVIDIGSSGARFQSLWLNGSLNTSNYIYAAGIAGSSDGNTYVNFPGSDVMQFYFGGSEKLRIQSDGRMFKGTTSAIQGEDISHEYNSNNGPGLLMNSTDTQGTNHDQIIFRRNGANVGSIHTNGAATAYNTSSDRRLKSNIRDAASASDKIDAIQVRQFDWNVDGSHQDYGLIAQELQVIEPLAVSAVANSDEMMGVDYSKLVPMLIKAVQEQQTTIKSLETRIAAVEAS